MTVDERTRLFYQHIWPYRAMVLRSASFLCGKSHEAEDVAQETLMKAFAALEQLDVSKSAAGWLNAILRHTRIDRLRSTQHQQKEVSLEAGNVDVPDTKGEASETGASDAASLLEAISDETIITALKQLPEDIRWTLLLVDVHGMDHQEAAKILEVPPGTVKSRAFRGRRLLKELLVPAHQRSVKECSI